MKNICKFLFERLKLNKDIEVKVNPQELFFQYLQNNPHVKLEQLTTRRNMKVANIYLDNSKKHVRAAYGITKYFPSIKLQIFDTYWKILPIGQEMKDDILVTVGYNSKIKDYIRKEFKIDNPDIEKSDDYRERFMYTMHNADELIKILKENI